MMLIGHGHGGHDDQVSFIYSGLSIDGTHCKTGLACYLGNTVLSGFTAAFGGLVFLLRSTPIASLSPIIPVDTPPPPHSLTLLQL